MSKKLLESEELLKLEKLFINHHRNMKSLVIELFRLRDNLKGTLMQI